MIYLAEDKADCDYVWTLIEDGKYIKSFEKTLIEDAGDKCYDKEQLLELCARENLTTDRYGYSHYSHHSVGNKTFTLHKSQDVVNDLIELASTIPKGRVSVAIECPDLLDYISKNSMYDIYQLAESQGYRLNDQYTKGHTRLYSQDRSDELAAKRKKKAKASPKPVTDIRPVHVTKLLTAINKEIQGNRVYYSVIKVSGASTYDSTEARIEAFALLSKMFTWKEIKAIRARKDSYCTLQSIPPIVMSKLGAIWSNSEKRKEFLKNYQPPKKRDRY